MNYFFFFLLLIGQIYHFHNFIEIWLFINYEMNFNYKIGPLKDATDNIDSQENKIETDDPKFIEILGYFANFQDQNPEIQNLVLIEAQKMFFPNFFTKFNNPNKILIISNFILKFIQSSQCTCSIINFLNFFAYWTFSHNVKNESFSEEKITLLFLLFHSIQHPSYEFDIKKLSLITLLSIINDSSSMRKNLVKDCLQDGSQLFQFTQTISDIKNEKIAQIIFRIFNLILKTEGSSGINFGIVIDNLIYPSLANFPNDFPNDVIKFVRLYMYFLKKKNGKKDFFSRLSSSIPFENMFKSLQLFNEEKNSEILLFLRSYIDNNEWEYELSININFECIINYLSSIRVSNKLHSSFCKLLISYFQHLSNYDIGYDYGPLFKYIHLMTNCNFKIRDYVLIIYFTIFVTSNSQYGFNPLLFISQDYENLMVFLFDFLENDSDNITEKATKVILSILHLLSKSTISIEKQKNVLLNLLLEDRFDPNENQSIKIILEEYNSLFPSNISHSIESTI